MENYPTNYSKGGMGKWIILYFILAVIVYGAVYYYVSLTRGGLDYNGLQYQQQENNQPTGLIENNTELNAALQDLNSADLNQIDSELSQNDTDSSSF